MNISESNILSSYVIHNNISDVCCVVSSSDIILSIYHFSNKSLSEIIFGRPIN